MTDHKQKNVLTVSKTTELAYYRFGLFISSYSLCSLSLAAVSVLIFLYPLFSPYFSPLPGKIPTKLILPYNYHSATLSKNFTLIDDETSEYFQDRESLPRWTSQLPFVYVQQIIMRAATLPHNNNNAMIDAFRGPLFEVFKLLEITRNHETNVSLSDVCFHVENVKRSDSEVLFPEYNCLVLSPANLWRQNLHNFKKDNLLKTVFQHHNNQKARVSTSEMLFGVPLSNSGMKRYPSQNRSRIIQYAITLFLKENNEDYINSLRQKLYKFYPLHQKVDNETVEVEGIQKNSSVIYVYYPREFNLIELVPLSIASVILFVYIYKGVPSLEMIRSRLVLALAAVITVLGSLAMSFGFCFFFGISIWAQSSQGAYPLIYPYLLFLVGLENCLVLTKSVTSQNVNLDTKIRVAQGLSKEGWPITKNLMTEITICTGGLVLTFLPLLQEFCIFAIVGLVSDYFLQMFFFATILSLNLKKVAVIAEVKKLPKMIEKSVAWNKRKEPGSLNRSISHPSQLSELDQQNQDSSNVRAPEKKIPKRLRIVNFWARTRFFQRGFMIWMVLWISNIIYNSGIIESAFLIEKNNTTGNEDQKLNRETVEASNNYESMEKNLSNIMKEYNIKNWTKNLEDMEPNISEKIHKLKHPQFELSSRLSSFHWASILKQYNVSMIGRYVLVLPAIKLSHIVPFEVAKNIRNPLEKPPSSKWNALTSALDDDSDSDDDLRDWDPLIENQPLHFRPKSPTEMVLLVILCSVSCLVIIYTVVVFYRCICSRNYAEWRASHEGTVDDQMNGSEQVLEGFPIQVKGHKYNVECVVSDGNYLASCDLAGLIKIWDSTNGEQVAEIDRNEYFDEIDKNNGSRTNSRSLSISHENLIQQPAQNEVDKTTRLRASLKFDFQSARKSQSDFDSMNEFQKSYDKYFEPRENISMKGESLTSVNTKSSTSINNIASLKPYYNSNGSINHSGSNKTYSSPIWALDFIDNLIAIGCADGRLEFWEGTTGSIKCIYQSESSLVNGVADGITHLKLAQNKVIAARLSGKIDFLRLETYTQGVHIDWQFTSAYRRNRPTHVRTGSAGSISSFSQQQTSRNQRNSFNLPSPPHSNWNQSPSQTEEELRCILELQHQGHSQPITVLDLHGNTLFSGSQDHTLKVFLTDANILHFTLHGHTSPISAILIDRFQPSTGYSGSQDGLLFVWDFVTGACLYNLQAHEECLVSIASAPSYIITLGLDERIRVWERFQGHLLSTIILHHAYSNSIVMLTPSLLVTAKPGSLLVWDIKDGCHMKSEILLDRSEMCQQITPKIMLASYGQIITDFGRSLRIVRFPLHEKQE